MKKQLSDEVERCRKGGKKEWGATGMFMLLHPKTGRRLKVVACNGPTSLEGASEADAKALQGHPAFDWEHVSVSIYGPHFGVVASWDEMCWVKDQFWDPEEWVVQFHPAVSEYVNDHPGVLHLWRCAVHPFPTPPKVAV